MDRNLNTMVASCCLLVASSFKVFLIVCALILEVARSLRDSRCPSSNLPHHHFLRKVPSPPLKSPHRIYRHNDIVSIKEQTTLPSVLSVLCSSSHNSYRHCSSTMMSPFRSIPGSSTSSSSRPTHRYCTLTTLVKSLSHLHNSFYTPHHFPKFLFTFMSLSGVAGYYCMDWWYERSLEERTKIYSRAYHNHQQVEGKRQLPTTTTTTTARDEHYKGRKALFTERLTPYQKTQLQQQQQQQQQQTTQNGGRTRSSSSSEGSAEEKRLVTLTTQPLALASNNNQLNSLQRQVTKFW